ncbi:MAG: hypothetical protein D6737_11675 [Chloroflexi bacterium]|nr:MAG: hypothetical protein D6737_11675 [Chloroflexota bacterium]
MTLTAAERKFMQTMFRERRHAPQHEYIVPCPTVECLPPVTLMTSYTYAHGKLPPNQPDKSKLAVQFSLVWKGYLRDNGQRGTAAWAFEFTEAGFKLCLELFDPSH